MWAKHSSTSCKLFKGYWTPENCQLFLIVAVSLCSATFGQDAAIRRSSLPAVAQRQIIATIARDMTWRQLAELTGSDEASTDNFANSVAIDGDTVVVGAP